MTQLPESQTHLQRANTSTDINVRFILAEKNRIFFNSPYPSGSRGRDRNTKRGSEIVDVRALLATKCAARSSLIFLALKGIIRGGEAPVAAAEGSQRIKTAAVWKGRFSNESETLGAMILANKQRPRNLRHDVIVAASRLRMELLPGKRILRVYSASIFYLSPPPLLRCLSRAHFVSR